jgi:NAD-dependent deacetylase
MSEAIQTNVSAAVAAIRNANRIVVFTGAGISTESGIPDFRSPGGIWSKYDPREFTYQRFVESEEARAKIWKMSAETHKVLTSADPNPAHYAIVSLEKADKLACLITQNIDGLHQRAGTSEEKVLELHGTALYIKCLDCGKRYEREPIAKRVADGDYSPRCDDCKGLLKSATISFGQSMPREKMERAYAESESCDLFIVIGSSLVVQPAASLPLIAKKNGAVLMIINRDPTDFDQLADVVINASAGETMSMVVETLAL